MKRWTMLLAAFGFLIATIPSQAEAQVQFGPQAVVWDFEDVGVGARVDFALSDAFGIDDGFFDGLFASINGNYLFSDLDGTVLLFNGNASVPFDIDGAVTPYAGAGINHWRWSDEVAGVSVSSSNSGLNLLGGLFFDLGEIPAFGELQYSTTGAGFLSVSVGVLFGG